MDKTLIHRVPPEAKLFALFAFSVLLFALASPLALAWLAGAVVAVTLLCCRSAFVKWVKGWPLLLTIVALGIWTWFARGPEATSITLLRLGSLSLFATVVTATTTVGQFIDTVTRLARPLEKLGLANAGDIGLAIGLVVRFVPEIHARYRNVVDAHRARGLKLRPSTIIGPVIIATITSADEIANAIDARNIRTTAPKRK
ncbi:energy-coupling factor transporter transmembrane component T [Brucella pseudogrignonensis]|uniref:Biotin transport system permease protein n=1 Tax=Brucella pseudogrignonensis TaxID=419475 RepID=A0ABU1MBS3_9HYPH|nr:energy-coupling factor transporter transmembrane component T [Brucella pseudogrignonensis]MDR6433368.1 biotin transport system permease protein [Brucella pseudogrignonensis]